MANERNGFTVQVNGIDLFCEVAGDGEPLLLLHGGGGTHENWTYAGRDQFLREYKLIAPDARGHGRSTNPQRTITHRQCALDTLALLDHLGIKRCRAIGISMGGNILLHMATLQPDRIEAMVAVSCTMYFPEQARAIMRQVPVENQPPSEWETMRKRHVLGDDQIVALWEWQRGMSVSYDDMNFTTPSLARITAATLIVYGVAISSIPSKWRWTCIAPSPNPRSGSYPMAVMVRSSSTPPRASPKRPSLSCEILPERCTLKRCPTKMTAEHQRCAGSARLFQEHPVVLYWSSRIAVILRTS